MRDIPPAAEIAMHGILAAVLAFLGTIILLPRFFSFETEWMAIAALIVLVTSLVAALPGPRLAGFLPAAGGAILATAATTAWWAVSHDEPGQQWFVSFDDVLLQIASLGLLVTVPAGMVIALLDRNASHQARSALYRTALAVVLTVVGASVASGLFSGRDDVWPLAVRLMPVAIGLLVALPRLISGTFLLASATSLALTAVLQGRDLVRDEFCDCSGEHLFRFSVDETVPLVLSIIVAAGYILLMREHLPWLAAADNAERPS